MEVLISISLLGGWLSLWFLFCPAFDQLVLKPAVRAGNLPVRYRRDNAIACLIQWSLVGTTVTLSTLHSVETVPINWIGWLWISLPASTIVVTIVLNSLAVLRLVQWVPVEHPARDNLQYQRAIAGSRGVVGFLFGLNVIAALATMRPLDSEPIRSFALLVCLWPISAWHLTRTGRHVIQCVGENPDLRGSWRLMIYCGAMAIAIWFLFPTLPVF